MNRLLELAKGTARQMVPRWLRTTRRTSGRHTAGHEADVRAASCTRPDFSASTLELQRIETQAERTIVQEIRLFERHVREMLSTLQGEDLAYAHGLLLKLDRLARDQQADSQAPTHVAISPCDWQQLPA
jgi:hypothetical protein